MRVRFVQTGGYTGLVKGCEIDTASLPSDEAKELERLVRESGISAASGSSLSAAGRDLQDYELTIEEEGSKISATLDDGSLPASAKPLIGYLKKRSRPQPLE